MDPVFIWTAVILLSALLLTAGWHKTSSPAYYRELIRAYTGLPAALAGLGGKLTALTEICVAVLLLLPATRIASAWVAVALLLLYSLLITISLLRGLAMDCGCSGPLGRQRLCPWLLVRNGALLLLAWVPTHPSLNRVTGTEDYLIILCSSAALICIYLACEQLLSNRDKLVLLRSR